MSSRETQLSIEDIRDLASIGPAQFQAASDFSVELAARVGGAGTVLRLVDSSLDVTIEFPWWDDPEGISADGHWETFQSELSMSHISILINAGVF
jgi:hypothetical protein